ncbi:MAG: tRNA-specific 2-thiouridylase [Elusimicrobia bacterium]|nr:tRNA-specific 2-thiouridylase [Elusimicrobiota bacterium]
MKILALMSGGVDSSVAAYLLKREGHEVVGMTMKLFDVTKEGPGCCGSPRDVYDAKEVASAIDIAHYMMDESDQFRRVVIEKFKSSYRDGETPNPCIECNRSVKFGHALKLAEAWGFDAVATGHYARIRREKVPSSKFQVPSFSQENFFEPATRNPQPATLDRVGLFRAADRQKDQSYFLYMLNENQLANILFPLGELEKSEVRRLAEEASIPTAAKPESQEICFVGATAAGDYRNLFRQENKEGPIVEASTGRILGRHEGYTHFTTGQRSGLGIAVGHPMYVTGVEPATATVYVGSNDQLLKRQVLVREVSWVNSHLAHRREFAAHVKIRSKSPPASARLVVLGRQDSCLVSFDEPQRAPTPGQFAVFYDGERVLGGGKISL